MTFRLPACALLLLIGCAQAPAPSAPAVPTPPPVVVPTPPPAASVEAPTPAVAPEPVQTPGIDVKSLIGIDKAAVAHALGDPKSCETVTPSRVGKVPKCLYRDGGIEVVFINGRADWITVHGSDAPSPESAFDARLDAGSLSLLNLSGTPTATTPIRIYWKDAVPGVHEVSMFGEPGGKISYVYIKAFTD